MPDFTTGPALLADVGELRYNGCVFSPLFETNVSGNIVKDNANRTTKLMEYVITADGYVTMPTGDTDINPTMNNLRKLLTAQGGALTYSGRGFDLKVNSGGSGQDVAWGPIPKILEFQPLGGGLSAKIKWQVVVHISEATATTVTTSPPGSSSRSSGSITGSLLQFNYETVLTYNDDGYSSMSIRGTMEIPLTRTPSQTTRILTTTVDDYRKVIEDRLFSGIDLSRFRFVRREFSGSRDKRTMEFDIEIEEKPYMDLPPFCTVARGTYNVRPARAGAGLATWHCTLKATYTVRADVGRRAAWVTFLALLQLRMRQAERPGLTPLDGVQNPPRTGTGVLPPLPILGPIGVSIPVLSYLGGLFSRPSANNNRKAFLIDFSFDEGLYLDSKTVSFSATWRLTVVFADILLASGLWTKLPESANNSNLWAASMRGVSGVTSWLPNRLDPALDVIVDFGS